MTLDLGMDSCWGSGQGDGGVGREFGPHQVLDFWRSDCWRLSGCAFQVDGEVKRELRWTELRSLQAAGGFIWLDVALC